jgi:hypothetical protein
MMAASVETTVRDHFVIISSVRDSLLPILVALSVDRGGQRGAASDKRSAERCERAQKGWIDLHFAPSWCVALL